MSSQNVLAIGSTHIKGELRARNLWLEGQQWSWNVGNSVQQVRTPSLLIILFLSDGLSGHIIRPVDSISQVREYSAWCT